MIELHFQPLFVYFLFLFVQDRVSSSAGGPATCYVAEDGLEPQNLQLPPIECWFTVLCHHFRFMRRWDASQGLYMLGEHSTN